MQINESLSHWTSTEFMEWFMGYMEKSAYALV
jgi:hypothetical protein